MLYELAYLSIHNLLRARARLVMTAGGVMIGTTAVVLLIALTNGLQTAAEASIGSDASLTQITIRSSFRRDSSSPTLNAAAVTQLQALPDVSAVVPILSLSKQVELHIGNLKGFAQVFGINPANLSALGVKAQEGTFTLDNTTPYNVVVGASVASNFTDTSSGTSTAVDLMQNSVDLRIYNSDGTFRKIPITVNAVLESGTSQDFAIYLPLQTVMALNDKLSGTTTAAADVVFSQIIVQASSRDTVSSVQTAIQALTYNATGQGSYLGQLNSFFGVMRLMLGGVGGIALLVAAFGVANTMTMAILERTREIGLMKAVGATDQEVLTIFLIEAGLVGMIGGLTGLAVCYALEYIVNQLVTGSSITLGSISISQISGSLIVIPISLALLALGLATFIGICAGLYPASRAARMIPVNALKTD